MAKGCKVAGCDMFEDKERKTGLCSEHSSQWLRSEEFRESTRDEDVKAYMGLGLKTRAMMTVNRKYRMRWIKRIANAAEES